MKPTPCLVVLVAAVLLVSPSKGDNAEISRFPSPISFPSLDYVDNDTRRDLDPGSRILASVVPPADQFSEVNDQIRRPAYRFSPTHQARWSAPNRAQGFTTYVDPAGLTLICRTIGPGQDAEGWILRLTLTAYGREGALSRAISVRPIVHTERVAFHRELVTEWYVNDASGLKQGFTIDAPPAGGTSDAPLVLEMRIAGGLSAHLDEDGARVIFKNGSGVTVLHYASLAVWDAKGRPVEGRLAVSRGRVQIRIRDRGAAYPLTVDPLMTSPAWTAEGDQPAAGFGVSVATAGDVNGDGFSDVIVGAESYDNGHMDEGRAFLYLGSAAGLSASPGWTAESNQVSARFGRSVATAGDVNGDGFSDVIVGAPTYQNGQFEEGRAYLYLGSASGLSASPAWTVEGNQSDAEFGVSTSTAGDVNGDGYSDVIVGAWLYANGQNGEGRASVYLGSASGLATSPAWTAESDQANAIFGESVATAGDVNGDGYSDVIVGAASYDNGQINEGRVFLYHGSAGGLSSSPAWTAEGDQAGAFFGGSVAAAGDVNGDTFSDVIVGASGYDNGQVNEGRVFVYLGSAAGLSGSPAWTAESDQAGAGIGGSVATAGDVNGDTFSDVIVSAEGYDSGETDEGRVFVYLGSAAGLSGSPAWTAESNQSGTVRFGFSAGTAADVNGDSLSDVIIGAWGYDNGQVDEGRAFLYLGSATCQDVDGDGYGSPGNLTCLGGGQTDCDDTDSSVHPAAPELCDNLDNDCDGLTDEGNPGGGARCGSRNFGQCRYGITVCSSGQSICVGSVEPNAETCNSMDDDCDELIDEEEVCVVSGIDFVDPNYPSLTSGPDVTTDIDLLGSDYGRPVRGLVADGTTRVVVRFRAPSAGTVQFRLRDENGQSPGAGQLGAPGQTPGSAEMTVPVQQISDGRLMAFAVLLAPSDFVRGPQDDGLSQRLLTLTAEYTPQGGGTPEIRTVGVELHRPPVTLLHGIWGEPDSWGWSLLGDARFVTDRYDYSDWDLRSFSGIHWVPHAAIRAAVRRIRDGYNVAATQADAFGHSMGGLLLRKYAAEPDYRRDENYRRGSIHKLVTVDTPHLGSPLANAFSDLARDPVHGWKVKALACLIDFCPHLGAVDDLRMDSPEILNLPAADVPAHAFVGKGGSDMSQLGLEMLPEGRPLLEILDFFGIQQNALFPSGLQHDAVVGRLSQEGRLGTGSSQTSVFGFVSLEPRNAGVHFGSVAREAQVGSRAVDLLNTHVLDPLTFAPGFPAAGPATSVPTTTSSRYRVPSGVLTNGIRITNPSPGIRVTPGTSVTVSVEGLGGFVPTRVLMSSPYETKLLRSAPFTGQLDVPTDAAGGIMLSAAAFDAANVLATAEDVIVEAEFAASLVDLSVEPSPLYLFSESPSQKLRVIGHYDDGVDRDVTGMVSGTTYVSADPTIATVDEQGLVTGQSVGRAAILISNGIQSVLADIVVATARLQLSVDAQGLSWPRMAGAVGYDVVRGDVGLLRSSGGDFGVAVTECLANNFGGTALVDAATPNSGQAFWYLVRAVAPAGGLTYNEADFLSASQVESRDAEINSSPNACP